MLNKKGKEYSATIAAIVLVVLAVWLIKPSVFSSISDQPAVQTTQQVIADTCGDPSNTMKVGPQSAKWNPGTSVSTENVYVWKIPYDTVTKTYKATNYDTNTKVGSKSDASTETVGFKDKLAFLYGYASATYWQNYVEDVVAPCAPFDSGAFDSGAAALIANATTSLYAYNDDNLRNEGNGANNMTLGTADTKTFNSLRMETGDKTGFAPRGKNGPGKYLVIVEVNKSMYDEENFQLGGKTTNLVAPGFYTPDGTDSATKAWEFSGCPIGTATRCIENYGGLYVDVASGVNPTGGHVTNVDLGDIKICFKPADWYLDTYTYEPKYDYAKNDGTDASTLISGNGVCYWLAVT